MSVIFVWHSGLCSWVVNIIGFYKVFCDVEPKRKALDTANSELAAAEDKLAKIKAKIKVRPSLIILCTNETLGPAISNLFSM